MSIVGAWFGLTPDPSPSEMERGVSGERYRDYRDRNRRAFALIVMRPSQRETEL